jgi:hypothetical protein
MDFPFNPQHPPCRRRGPVALWALMAFVGIVLGAAALGAAMVTDTRDFAARHGAVLGTQAL